MLEHILVPYGKVQRSAMKWYTFEFPAIQVPEKFFVALWFDAESTKGVYVGKDKNITEIAFLHRPARHGLSRKSKSATIG